MSRLEKQIRFRDVQIEKLTTKCSLLQIEIATMTEESRPTKTAVDEKFPVITEIPEAEGKPETEDKNIATEPVEHKIKEIVTEVPERVSEADLPSWEASAMLVASLNNQLMQVLQVLPHRTIANKKISSNNFQKHQGNCKVRCEQR